MRPHHAVAIAEATARDVAQQLSYSARLGNWKEVLTTIKEHPDSINTTRPIASATFTALAQAVFHGQTETVTALLAAGADPTVRLNDGRTIQQLAASRFPDAPELREAVRTPICTLSHVLRREAGAGFPDILSSAADRRVFDDVVRSVALMPLPDTPLEVARELMSAFERVTDGTSMRGGTTSTDLSSPLKLGRWRALVTAAKNSAMRSVSTVVDEPLCTVSDALSHSWAGPKQSTSVTLERCISRLATVAYSGDEAQLRDAISAAFAAEQANGATDIALDDLLAIAAAWVSDRSCAQTMRRAMYSMRALPGDYYCYAQRNSPLFGVSTKGSLSWFAVGDWGETASTAVLAARLARFLRTNNQTVDFIQLLGDNFYPSGVTSPTDKRFATQWADAFLEHEELRRPYKMVIGNHDRTRANGIHQVLYTDSPQNVLGLWQYRGDSDPSAPAGHCYDFQCAIRSGDEGVPVVIDFHVVDTCATQFNSRRHNPTIVDDFQREREVLRASMAASAAANAAAGFDKQRSWRVVSGHHGFYTQGAGHHDEGVCLRTESYTTSRGGPYAGLDFEKTLVEGGVDLYFCGHDHVLQHTAEKGIDHICSGSSIEFGYYGGRHPAPLRPVDWFNDSSNGAVFNQITVSPSGASEFVAQFVDLVSGRVIHEVRRRRGA